MNEEYVKDIVMQLCEALDALHCLDIVHRDIKPENVILRGNEAVLIDFDVSRVSKPEGSADTHMMGTSGYAAPEQYGFSQTDGRSDIYALGVMLNEMLTKQHPAKFLTESAFRPIVEKCIAVNADQRYGSAAQLRGAVMKAGFRPNAAKQKRIRMLLPACFLVPLIVGGLVFFGGRDSATEPPAETFPANVQETVQTPTAEEEALSIATAGIYMEAENGAPKGDVIVMSRKNDSPPWGFWLDYSSDNTRPFAFWYYDAGASSFVADSDMVSVAPAGEHLWEVSLKEEIYGDQVVIFTSRLRGLEENIFPVFFTDLTPGTATEVISSVWAGEPKASWTVFHYDLDSDGQEEEYVFGVGALLFESVGYEFCQAESFSFSQVKNAVRLRDIAPCVWRYNSSGLVEPVLAFAQVLENAQTRLWRVTATECTEPTVYRPDKSWPGSAEIWYSSDHVGTWLYEITAELEGEKLSATALTTVLE